MNNINLSTQEVKVTLNDLYSLLFSLNMNSDTSTEVSEQIKSIERIISYNITRKDVPVYSLQQTIELSESDAENILGDKKLDYIKLNQIRQKVSQLITNRPSLA